MHQIRHDRSKEHGAFATPKGRPRKAKVGLMGLECKGRTGAKLSSGYRDLTVCDNPVPA